MYLSHIDDLSYNKAATQSHTFTGRNYGADNAVDENIMTCMRTNEIGRIAPYKTLWWKVDLDGPRNIYSINILFKNYIGLGNDKTIYLHSFFFADCQLILPLLSLKWKLKPIATEPRKVAECICQTYFYIIALFQCL